MKKQMPRVQITQAKPKGHQEVALIETAKLITYNLSLGEQNTL